VHRSTFDGQSIREVWAVGSRSVGGQMYTVDVCRDAAGVESLCDCQAALTDRICWHRCAAREASAGRLPCHNPTGSRMHPQRRPAAPAPAVLPTIGGKPVTQAMLTGKVRRSA